MGRGSSVAPPNMHGLAFRRIMRPYTKSVQCRYPGSQAAELEEG